MVKVVHGVYMYGIYSLQLQKYMLSQWCKHQFSSIFVQHKIAETDPGSWLLPWMDVADNLAGHVLEPELALGSFYIRRLFAATASRTVRL